MQNEENKTTQEPNSKLYVGGVLAGILGLTVFGLLTGKQDTVISFYKSAGLLLTALSILVLIHEWGHYITAKMFGMRVEKFYLFFDAWGVKLFSFTKNGTEYGMGWLPLGGYVKISGIIDENMDTSFLESEPQPWEFRSKPVWQRIIVMIGGVVMNVILGILILSAVYLIYGEEKTPMSSVKNGIEVRNPAKLKTTEGTYRTFYPIAYQLGLRNGDEIISFKGEKHEFLEGYSKPNLLVKEGGYFEIKRNGKEMKIEIPANAMDMLQSDTILPSKELFGVNVPAKIQPTKDPKYPSMALKAGLQAGDIITKLDSTPITYYVDIFNYTTQKKPEDSIKVTYTRAGQEKQIAFKLDTLGKMGVGPDSLMLAALKTQIDYNVFTAFGPGTRSAFEVVGDNVAGIGKMFKGKISARKSMMGPVGMGQAYGRIFDVGGWRSVIYLTGVISMLLAFFNIIPLPLPVLDGGHVMFLLYEWIRGKAAPMKVFFIAQNIGIFLVLGLMLFSFGNDLLRIFLK